MNAPNWFMIDSVDMVDMETLNKELAKHNLKIISHPRCYEDAWMRSASDEEVENNEFWDHYALVEEIVS